jgi:hypothetical protein
MSAPRIWHDFHNIVSKVDHKLYVASGSVSTKQNFGCAYVSIQRNSFSNHQFQFFLEQIVQNMALLTTSSAPLHVVINISKENGPRREGESHMQPTSDKIFRQFSKSWYYGIRCKYQNTPMKRFTISCLAFMILGRRLSTRKQKLKTLNCDIAC